MHRLIMHEKCHFMWANLFSASIRADWAAVGGWSEDPAATSGWTTTQTTQVQRLTIRASSVKRSYSHIQYAKLVQYELDYH